MQYNEFFTLLKSGALKGMYLLHGPEEYTKQSALQQLKESVEEAARDLNVQVMEKPLSGAVRAACETLPFFAERRIVIASEMADAEVKLLLPYSEALPDTTLLVLTMRGECGAALKKTLGTQIQEVFFNTLNEQEAMRFVLDRAKKSGVTLARNVAALLVDMVGTDVHALENELYKVLDYAGSAPVLEDFVAAAVTPNPEYQRYQMLDDLLLGRSSRGMRALSAMLKDGSESVFGLAHFFTGQCKSMLQARLLLDGGAKERDIANKLKLYPKAAQAAALGASKLNAEQLRDAVLAFSEVDYLQVSGQAPGERALTSAVLRYFCAQSN